VISVLRDDAFEAELAGVLEDGQAIALDVLVVVDAGRRLSEQLLEARLAGVQRLRPVIYAIDPTCG
jgi:hypothetical protein